MQLEEPVIMSGVKLQHKMSKPEQLFYPLIHHNNVWTIKNRFDIISQGTVQNPLFNIMSYLKLQGWDLCSQNNKGRDMHVQLDTGCWTVPMLVVMWKFSVNYKTCNPIIVDCSLSHITWNFKMADWCLSIDWSKKHWKAHFLVVNTDLEINLKFDVFEETCTLIKWPLLERFHSINEHLQQLMLMLSETSGPGRYSSQHVSSSFMCKPVRLCINGTLLKEEKRNLVHYSTCKFIHRNIFHWINQHLLQQLT